MIESATKDGVAVPAMRDGEANGLDTGLCQALCGALDDAAAAGGAAAVVLTGAGTMFSAAPSSPAYRRAESVTRARSPQAMPLPLTAKTPRAIAHATATWVENPRSGRSA